MLRKTISNISNLIRQIVQSLPPASDFQMLSASVPPALAAFPSTRDSRYCLHCQPPVSATSALLQSCMAHEHASGKKERVRHCPSELLSIGLVRPSDPRPPLFMTSNGAAPPPACPFPDRPAAARNRPTATAPAPASAARHARPRHHAFPPATATSSVTTAAATAAAPPSLASLRPFSDNDPAAAAPASSSLSRDADLSPLSWRTCFDDAIDLALPDRGPGAWRVYSAGITLNNADQSSQVSATAGADPNIANNVPPPTIVVLLHGAGHCALVWGIVATHLKPLVPIIAFDARGHGTTTTTPPSINAEDPAADTRLDVDTQVDDARALLRTLFDRLWPASSKTGRFPGVVLCGHSMGGAIAAKLAKTYTNPELYNKKGNNDESKGSSQKDTSCKDNSNDNDKAEDVAERVRVRGLIVVDVVEGTAMAALPTMPSVLAGRTRSFSTLQRAIRYVVKSGLVRNPESARLSVPAQLRFDHGRRCWVWRTNLERTQPFWHGWFNGLSETFVSAAVPKLLILANVNRLDKPLMIAQMQGKFQNIVITAAGHAIHEDQPEQTAAAIEDFLDRNMLVDEIDDEDGDLFMMDESADQQKSFPIFQQRSPVQPHR